MKKRWIWTTMVALALCIACFTLLPARAEAAEIDSGTCGDNLAWVLDNSGTLTISGIGEMNNYNDGSNAAPWFTNRTKITHVVVEDGVTSIGKYAFYACLNMESITIADTVTRINDNSFHNCTSLTIVDIPNHVTRIGIYAFRNCSGLSSITMPDSITHIGSSAFDDCRSLTSVYISDLAAWLSVEFRVRSSNPLHYGADLYCDGQLVADLIIPEGISNVGDYSFVGCRSLTSITIPEGCVRTGDGAFESCRNLTSVTLPEGLASINHRTFNGCSSLTSVIIPDGVMTICSQAFSFCDSLVTVAIPDSVTSISDSAFMESTNLWHVLFKGTEEQWGAISIDSANTCLTSAIRHYNCTGGEEIDIKTKTCSICLANCTHAWNGGQVTTQPTCAEEGVKTYTCTVCNATKTEAIAKTVKHTYGSWTKDNDSTHKHTCSVCSKAESASHTWNSGNVTKPATCTAAGEEIYTCTACSATKTETIATTGHSYDKKVTSATCTMQGYITYTCTACSDSYKANYVAASGHKETDDRATAATCTTTGLTEGKHCSVCQAILVTQNVIPATGHSDSNQDYVCDLCGSKLCTNHTEEVITGTSATCEQNGLSDGKKCANCGDILLTQKEIPALGHSYSDWIEVKAPTTKENGLEERNCATCGAKEQRELAQLEPAPTEPITPAPTEPAPTSPAPTVPDSTTPSTQPGTEPSTTAPAGNEIPNEGNNSIVLIAVLAAIGGIAVGGVAVLIVLKKKK